MTLRTKALLIVVAATISLILVLYAALDNILLAGFAGVEEQNTQLNVQRALDALSAQLQFLENKSADWANWDDTYAFVEDGNPDYIQSNLADQAFMDLDLAVILFIRTPDQLVFGKAFDLENAREMALPQELRQRISREDLLLKPLENQGPRTGILMLPEGPLLLVSRPILTSQGQGPSRGTLIMGDFLDPDELKLLSDRTKLTLSAQRVQDPQLPADFQAARNALSSQDSTFVQPLNRNEIAGYALLKDIYGQPALLLKTSMPRPIYAQGRTTMLYILLALVLVGLVFGTVSQLLIARLLRFWQARKDSEERFRAVTESAIDGIISADGEGKIVTWNKGAEGIFGTKTADAIGRSIASLMPEANQASTLAALKQVSLEEDPLNSNRILEVEGIRQDGSAFPAEISLSTWETTQGRFFGAVVRDITERKRTQEAERDQRTTLAEALRDTAAALNATLDFDDVLERILDNVGRVVQHDASSILLVDGDHYRVACNRGYVQRGVKGLKKGLEMPGDRYPLIRRVIQSSQPVVVSDTQGEPRWLALPEVAWVRSHISLPIRIKGETIGILNLESATPNFFTRAHTERLQTFADQAASAVENARLFAETQHRLQHLRALRAIDLSITTSFDLNLTLDVVLTHVLAQLKVDAADVLLLDPQTNILSYAAGLGFHSKALQYTALRLGEGLAGRAALERQRVSVSDLRTGANGLRRSRLFTDEDFLAYYGVPLVAKGQTKGVLEVFHRAKLEADAEWLELMDALGGQAAIAIDNAQLFTGLEHSNRELALAYDLTIEGWSHALDLRDQETEGHTQRVTEMTVELAREMGVSDADLVHVRRGALLHDIGKMGIPDSILLKPGPLTEDEWKVMRKHPVYAYELLSPVEYLRPALDIPYCHHEKWDGTGYPRGLKGEQIPFVARIFAVVDVWDALRSDRPYRAKWPDERVLNYIREQSGTHFDPQVVDVLLAKFADSARPTPVIALPLPHD